MVTTLLSLVIKRTLSPSHFLQHALFMLMYSLVDHCNHIYWLMYHNLK